MYICVCNGLNERRVGEALSGAPRTVSQIYRACGCAVKCGKCVPMMRDILDAHLSACSEPQAAPA
jgi:bacterioferritin-associated ferredoxin